MASRLKLGAQVLALGLVAGLLVLLAWSLVDQSGENVAADLERGKTPPAPGFSLERLDRPGKLSLKSLRGKAVVINFWASWCDPCRTEAPVLERAWQEYRDQGVVVLGIDVQDVSSDARRFARRYGMTYPIVRDGPGATMQPYGVTAVPETFLVARSGKLVARLVGEVEEGELTDAIERALAS